MRSGNLKQRFVDDVLELYGSLPGTRHRPSRQDRRLAGSLHDRGLPYAAVRAALLLAAARRTLRSSTATPLPPIGCLHYFLPVLDEVIDNPPDPHYLDYLAVKLQPFLKPTTHSQHRSSTTGQKTALSRGR